MRRKGIGILIITTLICFSSSAQNPKNNRWEIQSDGSITWNVKDDIPHYDHVEMSGEKISAVLRYGVNPDGSFRLERSVIWPMLRTIPNNTHASLRPRLAVDIPSLLMVNGVSLKSEQVTSFSLDGCLTVVSDFTTNWVERNSKNRQPVVQISRKFFPSVDKPVLCEQYQVKNISSEPVEIMIPDYRSVYQTDPAKGVTGSYTILSRLDLSGTRVVSPGSEVTLYHTIQAYSENKGEYEIALNLQDELKRRTDFVSEMWNNLILETPDNVINRTFAFAKIRAAESVYRTAGGLMHSPGGEAYYAAIWANDESEYVAPFFPFLGYDKANEATLNAFRLYMKYMNDDYKPVPSSIIAEGIDIWHGAGDCGDAAMLAYGGTRYALARGDKGEAKYIWPLMEWCLEYCHRNLNEGGVVKSDSDELENRFPSGDANILVSSLYYDALISASFLGKELGLPKRQVNKYKKQARDLRKSIDDYFGANVEGFETYSYFKGYTLLRSWICAPLFAGIQERAEATTEALFSKLWTENGLLTQTGSNDFWDRSTLSALRAAFIAGETEKAIHYLTEYSSKRLLGDHVPYPIEAWPEGNQRHLSGESALYCRIAVEGLFGIRPIGFKKFSLTPRLPKEWDSMALRRIKGFDSDFDIYIIREGADLKITIQHDAKRVGQYITKEGKSLIVELP